MREVIIEETDNDDRDRTVECYICGWTLPVGDSVARSGVHICYACDDEFDQILLEDI